MTNKLKITTIGNSAGIILPKDMLEKLRASKGDTIFAIETSNGFEITGYDAAVAEQMEVAEKVMRKHRDVLRKLAE